MTRSAAAAHPPAVLDGFDLTDQRLFRSGVPYDLFARLRAEAPVLWHPPGVESADGEGFWVVTRYEHITHVCEAPAFSAQGGGSRAGGGSHLEDLPAGVHTGVLVAMMDDPRHQLIKDVMGPAVSRSAAEAMEPGLRSYMTGVVADRLDEVCDLVADISAPIALHAVATVLGVPAADEPLLAAITDHNLGFVNRATGRVDDESRAVFGRMSEYFQQLCETKLQHPGVDLTSAIAHGRHGGAAPEMSAYERAANTTLMLITGFEQPRNTLAAAALTLAQHPGAWAELRADRSLLPSAVDEILRWNPPNPFNRRTATRDVVLGGETIHAGDKVTIWWPSGNRDGSVFPDADTFDIRRDAAPHLAFGHGRHHCLGESIGRLEIRLFLEVLLDHVCRITPRGVPEYAPNNKHTVMNRMPVQFESARRERSS